MAGPLEKSIFAAMNGLYAEMLRRADPGQVAGLSRFFKTGPGQYGYGDQFWAGINTAP